MAKKPKTKTKEKPLPRWAVEAMKRWDTEGDPDHVKAITSANWIAKTADPIGGRRAWSSIPAWTGRTSRRPSWSPWH